MTATWSVSIVFLLLALLLFGGLAAVVLLLVFPRTRRAGAALLAAGGLLAMFLLFAAFWVAPGRVVSTSAPRSMQESAILDGATAIPSRGGVRTSLVPVVQTGIPVDMAEKITTLKPAAKPAPGTAEATGQTSVKAPAEEKKNPIAKKADATPAAAPAKKSPAWVGAPPKVLGESYQKTIIVGPYPTRQDCDAELPNELRKELNRYVELCAGQPAGATRVALPYEFLREKVVRGEWEETIQSPRVGPMTQLHVLLQFDPDVKVRILEERHRGIVAGRLWMGGIGLAAVLWLLAVMYGYLRIDLATRGAYRGRLRFAAALAILGPVAAVAVAVV